MRTHHILSPVLLCAILVVASCGRGETEIRTFESDTRQGLDQSDSAGVTISQGIEYLESFEGGKSLCSKINNLIVTFCFGQDYDGIGLEDASRSYSESLVADYRKDALEGYEQESYWLYNWSYTMSGRFADSFGDLQTYMVYSETYLGGAHGIQSMIPYIINLKTGEEVEEELLFSEGYEEPVSELIRLALQKDWGSRDDPGSTYCAMEEEGMVPNGYLSVSEEGVTWYYQPYVIACYAQGIVEAHVGWEDLKPYLNRSLVKF